MHKLIILIEPTPEETLFDAQWPEFLHWAEQIPGLRREVTSHVAGLLYGRYPCTLVHELFFDDLPAAQAGLASPPGVEAGKTLQRITGGRLTLLLAEHLEDSLAHIQATTPTPQ